MFLGIYRFEGNADKLLPAYDKLVKMIPPGNLHLQVCISDEKGISIYDACPSREIFEAFSSSQELQTALQGAGLPQPEVSQLGEVHSAFLAGKRAIPAE